MGYRVSPVARGPDWPESPVGESLNTKFADGAKKKKSRKSKNKDRSSPPETSSHVESAPSRGEDQSRPSKRKHESDPERKKKRKKHHDAKSDNNNVSMNVAKLEPEQTIGLQPEKSPEEPRTVHNGVEKATPSKSAENATTLAPDSVHDIDNLSTVELNNRGKPKKLRGSRPGGKDNLKVGFFTPDEVEKIENFKISWCNMHGIGNTTFNEMIQHSEREGAEWPGPPDAPSKHELWTDIYGVLPDRDRRSLYRFARRHFLIPGQKAHEWTKEQDEELVELMKLYPAKYALISKMLGRSDDDVTQRWKNRLQHREKMNRGNWNLDETLGFMKSLQDFFEAHKEINPAAADKDIYEMDQKVIPWGSVSDSIGNSRSRQQCADKWRKICVKVKAERAKGNKDYVFDPRAAVEKTSRWKERSCDFRSEERVSENDEDNNDEGPVASSTPASKLKYGFVDHQTMMGVIPKTETDTAIMTTSSPLPGDYMKEDELEVAYPSEPTTPATPAAINGFSTSPETSSPVITGSTQKRDLSYMARIKEKTKLANKPKSSKKRRNSEVEAESQLKPELVFPEVSSPSKEQDENDERRERKRRKKERKEKKRQRALERKEAEQARIEADAAMTAAQDPASGDKTKKHKKHRKPKDANAAVAAIAAATPDKKQKHHKSDIEPAHTTESPKKRRKSDAGPIAIAESPKSSKKPKDKRKKKKANQVDEVAIKQERSI
ncbi:uncharacterized protein N7477_000610 [Penicillium maclennaniae]|uniref:uncharacterized protein n=1 Tax=Penicillium maclennaniae TaxID=1343394 RepID=UPI002540A619|nr:uncharacterized protein N7477_000610 [Penicillium maclennaniae]KAJ5684265.1 hypothetical protein N7477_000610 [Penicillium maclennaniae]